MGTSVTDLTQGSLLLGFGRHTPNRNGEAWKKLVGQRPVSARLSLLPEKKVSWSALLSSTLFQIGLVAFVVAIPMFFPQKLVSKVAYTVLPLVAPPTDVPVAKPKPVVRPKIQPAPPPVVQQVQAELPKVVLPRPLEAPKPKPVATPMPVAPKIDTPVLEAKLDAPSVEPTRPREPVKVGNLSTGSVAPATVNLPPEKVQTGGFGDPDGLPGPSNPNKQANIGHLGSPLLPAGPGYGNGTGGANGVRGTVASAGFGNGTAVTPTGSAARGPVQAGGFAAASTSGGEAPKPKPAEAAPSVVPVVILAKPDPIYSDEARKLHIEGDVLVDVVFPATGAVRVVRVAKGLGHGLDEAAVRAAEQIRFKPAMQNGMPVDFPAVVHIEFQIAY